MYIYIYTCIVVISNIVCVIVSLCVHYTYITTIITIINDIVVLTGLLLTITQYHDVCVYIYIYIDYVH